MLQAHERLGDFEIIRLLGKGGMGEVYEARQSNPDRPVALKVLAPWLARDDEALQRFWREAKIPANLDHPGIVRIISTGTTQDGTAYYAMHLVRGVSLADMVKLAAKTPLPQAGTQPTVDYDTPSQPAPVSDDDTRAHPENPDSAGFPPMYKEYLRDRFGAVARIGAQAARALAYAHKQGSLHRDIKPSNLMVDHHNQVYLVDFGLTRGVVDVDGNGTNPGVVPGTPWYMSPEQAEGKKLDSRTDVYSLGVTLYELATQGLGPFSVSRQNREAVLSHVRTGQLLPLRTLAQGIPPALERIILKAMHYLPKKRYASAEELAIDLESFAQQSGDYMARAPRRGPAKPRRRWRAWVASALAGAALIAAVAVALNWRNRPEVDAGKKSNEIVAKLDGTRALPESLRDPNNRNVVVRLLDNNGVPRWSERLYGTGKYAPILDHFSLEADVLLALADPDRAHFEFAVEIAQLYAGDQVGIIFGLPRREAGPDVPSRFFAVRWEKHPVGEDAFGRITVGTCTLIKGNESRFAMLTEWLTPLPLGKDKLALAEWDRRSGWPFLKVKIHDENVVVSVPQRQPLSFSLAELKRSNREAFHDLTTAGAVGVWSRKGVALFKNATITPLE